jgi:hypothetical protein
MFELSAVSIRIGHLRSDDAPARRRSDAEVSRIAEINGSTIRPRARQCIAGRRGFSSNQLRFRAVSHALGPWTFELMFQRNVPLSTVTSVHSVGQFR